MDQMLPFGYILLLLCLVAAVAAGDETHLRISPESPGSGRSSGITDDPAVAYCKSWRLAAETNNAGHWRKVPSRCAGIVKAYISGGQYVSDSKMVARLSQGYAKSVRLAGDGKDVWIFDVDDTLISSVPPHYSVSQYGSRVMNKAEVDQWGNLGNAPALPWSLWLYKKLQGMGFQLVLLTGRKEAHRNATEQNLLNVGYRSWNKLIMREGLDASKTAMVYKSEKRAILIANGYKIHGSSGDQWSDLLGSPKAKRSFKLPNPMYHTP